MSSYVIGGESLYGKPRTPRIATLPKDDPRHGLNGYGNHGCRCTSCVNAYHVYGQKAKARKRSADPASPKLCSDCGVSVARLGGLCRECRQEARA